MKDGGNCSLRSLHRREKESERERGTNDICHKRSKIEEKVLAKKMRNQTLSVKSIAPTTNVRVYTRCTHTLRCRKTAQKTKTQIKRNSIE